jgi:hypothetical protein
VSTSTNGSSRLDRSGNASPEVGPLTMSDVEPTLARGKHSPAVTCQRPVPTSLDTPNGVPGEKRSQAATLAAPASRTQCISSKLLLMAEGRGVPASARWQGSFTQTAGLEQTPTCEEHLFRTFRSGWRAECSARSTVPSFSGRQRPARYPNVRLPCRRRPSCRYRRQRFPYHSGHH